MEYDRLTQMNNRSERVKLFCQGQLSRRFRVPVSIDDETARIIALCAAKNSEYAGDVIWLNGRPVNLANVKLQIKADYQPEVTTP